MGGLFGLVDSVVGWGCEATFGGRPRLRAVLFEVVGWGCEATFGGRPRLGTALFEVVGWGCEATFGCRPRPRQAVFAGGNGPMHMGQVKGYFVKSYSIRLDTMLLVLVLGVSLQCKNVEINYRGITRKCSKIALHTK